MATALFDGAALLAEARAATGLDDFGNNTFMAGFEVLLETFDRNLQQQELRERNRHIVLTRLISRLKMQDAFNRFPEILAQPLQAPMILTGLPRSCTSAFFNLLAVDPDARALLNWEMRHPEPLYDLAPGEPDPRRVALAAKMEAERDPEFDKMHYASADTPEECVLLHMYSFDGVQTGWEIMLEPYNTWFQNHSLLHLYQEYRDYLKLLQWQRPGRRWLLKAPAHMWAIDEIVQVFPDVSLVWSHRDPVAVTSSICSLTELLMRMMAGGVSAAAMPAFGHTVMEWYAASLDRGLAARQRLDPARVVDCSFDAFVDDPLGNVEHAYRHFGLPMSSATRSLMADYVAANPKGKHGQHSYQLEKFGLSEAQVRERYAAYLAGPWLQ